MRNKNESKNTFPSPIASSWAQLHSEFLYLLPPNGTGGQGMAAAVSSSHIVSAIPSYSCSSPAPVWGPWETVLHKLLQHGSFPRAAVLDELLQRGSLPWGVVLQEWTVPAQVSHSVTSPARKPAPVWAPLHWATGPVRSLLQCVLYWVTASFEFICLLQCEVLHGLQGGYLLHCGPLWAARGQLTLPWSSPCRGLHRFVRF